jgi:hypothetical protein
MMARVETQRVLHLSPPGTGRPAKRSEAGRVRGLYAIERAVLPHPDPLPGGEGGRAERGPRTLSAFRGVRS